MRTSNTREAQKDLAAELYLSGKIFVDRPVCQQKIFWRATVLQLKRTSIFIFMYF